MQITKSERPHWTTVVSDSPYEKLLVVLVSIALVGSVMAFGAVAQSAQQTDDASEDAQATSYLRVVHASPDAPAVNVSGDNETVLSDVPFGAVSDYLSLQAGTYNVTIAAAEDPDTVVFEGEVTLDPASVTTV